MHYIIFGLIALYALVCLSFYTLQENFLFHPKPLPTDFKFSHAKFKEEFFLKDSMGNSINLAYFSATDSAKGLVVYFHGNAHNIEHYSQFIDPFLNHNLDVVIMDYRSFGKSQGKTTPQSFYQDVDLISSFIQERYGHLDKIAYGKSLGTGLATYFASKQNTKVIILEAPYYKFSNTVNRWGALFLTKKLLKYRFRNAENLKLTECPVFIFHGEKDWLISVEASQKIKSEFGDRIDLTIIKDGKHNGLPEFPEYQSKLSAILKGI